MARHRAVRGLANHWRDELDDLDYCSEEEEPLPPPRAKPQKHTKQQPLKPAERQPFVSKKERKQQEAQQQGAQEQQPKLVSQRTDAQDQAHQPTQPGQAMGVPPGLGVAPLPVAARSLPATDAAVASLVEMGFGPENAASALTETCGSVEAALERLMSDSGGVTTTSTLSGDGNHTSQGPQPAPTPRMSEQLNLVVVGHVDAGKSTLMGRLLLLAGQVDSRALHRCAKEADALGKASFKYAFLLDHGADERERGVTIDVSAAFIRTARRPINVLDAPGHRDFVPNMVSGAAQADAVLLVLNASPGEFESGLLGQTLEHIWICRCLGISQLVVAVNKMDTAGWQQTRFDDVVAQVSPILAKAGYSKPRFVPVSAYEGINLVSTVADGDEKAASPTGRASGDSRPELDWYEGPTLLEALDNLTPPARTSEVGARICVSDTFRAADAGSAAFGAIAITGTVQSGRISRGQTMLLMPAGEEVLIKSLRSRGEVVEDVVAGDHVEAGLSQSLVDPNALAAGCVLCDGLRPARLAKTIEVQLRVLPFATLVTRGMPCELYCHASNVPAVVIKLICNVDKQGGRSTGPRPRALAPGATAIVVLEMHRVVPMELYNDCRSMGRVILRDAGKTVGAGIITAIL